MNLDLLWALLKAAFYFGPTTNLGKSLVMFARVIVGVLVGALVLGGFLIWRALQW